VELKGGALHLSNTNNTRDDFGCHSDIKSWPGCASNLTAGDDQVVDVATISGGRTTDHLNVMRGLPFVLDILSHPPGA